MCPEIIIFLKWTLKSFIVKRQKWKKCHRFDDWKGELIQKKKKALWCVLDRIKIPTKVNKVIIIYSKTSEYSGHTELLTQSFLLSSYSGLKSGLEIDRNFIYTILPNFKLCEMQNKSSEINTKIHSCFWDIMAYTDIPLECYSPSAWRCKLWK